MPKEFVITENQIAGINNLITPRSMSANARQQLHNLLAQVRSQAPSSDLLTAEERMLVEGCKKQGVGGGLTSIIDRLAPKRAEPVSGWEACEDMRKRPSAVYRFGNEAHRMIEGILQWESRDIWEVCKAPLSEVTNKELSKVAWYKVC